MYITYYDFISLRLNDGAQIVFFSSGTYLGVHLVVLQIGYSDGYCDAVCNMLLHVISTVASCIGVIAKTTRKIRKQQLFVEQ